MDQQEAREKLKVRGYRTVRGAHDVAPGGWGICMTRESQILGVYSPEWDEVFLSAARLPHEGKWALLSAEFRGELILDLDGQNYVSVACVLKLLEGLEDWEGVRVTLQMEDYLREMAQNAED